MTPTSNPHRDLSPLPEAIRSLVPDLTLPDPMDAPAIRWGVIGAGGIARTFCHDVPAYSSGTVSAVAARDVERARSFAAEFSIPTVCETYEELVAREDVDAIYVSTIHPMHHEHALLALRAGKPVLVEKAFAMNLRQASEMVEAARERGVFLMEAMWTRHLPHMLVAREIVRTGALGAVVTTQADHGQSLWHVPRLVEKELGGGALLDLGVYSMAFVQGVLPGARVLDAQAIIGASGVDVANVVNLREGDALGVARSNLSGRSATAAEIVFERGTVELPLQFYRPTALSVRTYPFDGSYGETVTWDAAVPGGFQYQAAEVARCLAAGALESERMPWSDTLAVMALMDEVRVRIGLTYDCD